MPRVLLVEDEVSLAELLGRGLANRGYEILRASNGREALDAFATFRPDIVITDLMMPEKEGWTLIGELRRVDAAVKIVAMSGGGLDTARTYLKLAQHIGANAVLPKPFSLEKLVEVLHGLR